MRKTTQCVAALLAALPSVARADLFLHAWESHHESPHALRLNADVSYFSTDSNFDGSGVLISPNGLNKYGRVETDAALTYGISPRLSLYGRGTWARIDLDSTTRPGTAYGLTDQSIAANYRIYESPNPKGLISSIDVQAQADLPAYSNSSSDLNQTPWFGDQSTDLSFGAFLNARILENSRANLIFAGGAAYTYRSKNLSASIPWSAAVRYLPKSSGFSASLMAFGISSLQTDPRANDTTLINNTSVSAGTSGSFITNSINPMLFSVRGNIGYETENELRFGVGLTQTVAGKNAPSGNAFEFTLQKRFDTNADPSHRDPLESYRKYEKGNQGFVTYAFEARVLRNSGKMNVVKIDKGSTDGVRIGQTFDIFTLKTDGMLGEPIARGKVSSVKGDEAILSIVEYFKEVWIEEGFIAKRPLQ